MIKAKKIVRLIAAFIFLCCLFVFVYIACIRTVIARICVNDTIEAFTSGDYTNNFYYLDVNGEIQDYLDTGELGVLILQNSNITPGDYDFKFGSPFASVIFKISYPDICEVYNKKYANSSEVIPTDTMQNELAEAIKSKDFNVVNESIQVDMVQYRNKWYILDNEDFMNAYSGGLYKQYKQMITDRYEQEDE